VPSVFVHCWLVTAFGETMLTGPERDELRRQNSTARTASSCVIHGKYCSPEPVTGKLDEHCNRNEWTWVVWNEYGERDMYWKQW
jgi:hypothetical protein